MVILMIIRNNNDYDSDGLWVGLGVAVVAVGVVSTIGETSVKIQSNTPILIRELAALRFEEITRYDILSDNEMD